MNKEELRSKIIKEIQEDLILMSENRKKELISREIKFILEKADRVMQYDIEIAFTTMKDIVKNIFNEEVEIEKEVKGNVENYKFFAMDELLLEMESHKKDRREVVDNVLDLIRKTLEEELK